MLTDQISSSSQRNKINLVKNEYNIYLNRVKKINQLQKYVQIYWTITILNFSIINTFFSLLYPKTFFTRNLWIPTSIVVTTSTFTATINNPHLPWKDYFIWITCFAYKTSCQTQLKKYEYVDYAITKTKIITFYLWNIFNVFLLNKKTKNKHDINSLKTILFSS